MSKPWGLSPTFQVTRPSKAEDLIHEAVEQAIIEQMTVKDFIRNARESWGLVLDGDKKHADQEFGRALEVRVI